jgi:NADH-ubiquinone oxidoreductase chain 5
MMGAAGALILYVWYPSAPYSRPIYVFLSNKWHIDAIYNNYVVRPLFRFALNVTYKVLDKGLIEWAGPTGISRIITSISLQVSHLQSGQVYNYALAILIFTSLFALPLPTTDLFFLIPLFIITYSF